MLTKWISTLKTNTKWKNSVAKDHTLDDPFLSRSKLMDTKGKLGALGFLGGNECILKLDCNNGYTIVWVF